MLSTNTVPDEMEILSLGSANEETIFRLDEVFRRAHEIHRKRGGFFGYDFDDWDQAWRELTETPREKKLALTDENGTETNFAANGEVLKPCFGCGN